MAKTGRRAFGLMAVGLLGAGFFMAFTASSGQAQSPATPLRTGLGRVESKLNAIKRDVIRFYQAMEAVPGREGVGLKRTETLQGETDLQEIARMMKNLESIKDRAAGSDPAPEEMRLADRLLQAGLVPQAERTLKDLAVRARRGPMADEAWFRLERLYYQSGDYQQALGAFSKISERPAEPIRPEALYLAGNSYLRLNDDRKAIDLLDRVGGGNESYPFALYSSGLARLRLKETGHSMPGPFRKLMAIHPGEDPVLRELIHKTRVTVGFFLNDQKRYPEAIALFETVPPKSVYRIPARFGIGISYLGMEECVKAVVVFGELIEQAPTDPYALEARLHIGTCYAKLNAYHKAMERYLDALAAYSARKENLKKLAERIQKLGAASTGADLIPADLRRELAIDRDFPELVEVYDDWFRLYGQISRIDPETQGRKAPAAGPDLKTMRDRTQEVRRELDGLLRTAMTDQVSARMERIDELVRRANIGITKNMILVQDHESAP